MSEKFLEPEDLLSDESFLAWYFKTGPEQERTWEDWMTVDPDRKALVDQAVEILEATRIIEKAVPAQQKLNAEQALMRRIASLPELSSPAVQRIASSEAPLQEPVSARETPTPKISWMQRNRWVAAASIIIVLVGGSYLSWNLLNKKPEIKTPYGQISHRQLPDGTEVVMNANSRLSYSEGWKDGKDREVWMNGEAFFHVTKTPLKSRFIVHTSRFDVIVTGTRFNVVDRHDQANVMLQEGGVIIHTRDGRDIKLSPGELAQFNDEQLEKRTVQHDSVLAWKDQKLVFDKTPLRVIVSIIKDEYGINVNLTDDSVGNKTVSGILPNNNLDVLLEALEATSDFSVKRTEQEISIGSAPPR